MSRKALEMQRLFPYRYSVRGTWREGSNTEDVERYVMAGSGKGAFHRAPQEEPKAISKGGLGHHFYWTRLLSFNRLTSRFVIGLLNGYNTLRIQVK